MAEESKIRVRCDCGRKARVKAALAGRSVKCPECGEKIRVPALEEATPEVKPKAKAKAKPEAKAKTKPEAKAKTKPEAKAKTKPEAKAKTKPEAKGGKAKTPAKRRKGAASPAGTSETEEPVKPKSKSKGIPLPLYLGLGAAALALLIGALLVVLFGGEDTPPTTTPSPTEVATSESPTASGSPVATGEPAQAPSGLRFPAGPPPLPDDAREALDLINAYEKEHPKDATGLVKLHERLLQIVGADSRSAPQIERRLDQLREQEAGDLGGAFDGFQSRVQAELDEEDYLNALAVWDEALESMPGEVRPAIEEEISRVKRMREQSQRIAKTLEALGEPDPSAADEVAMRTAGEVLLASVDVEDSPGFEALSARALAERAILRGALRDSGAARVQSIRDAVAAAAKVREDAVEARAKTALRVSKERPLTVGGVKMRVKSLAEDAFTLVGKGGNPEVDYRFDTQPKLTADVLERANRDGHPEDLVELIVFCLKHRLFGVAKRMHKKLRKQDADLAGTLPDLAMLQRASQPFLGDSRDDGDGTVYDFAAADGKLLLGDWEPLPDEAELSVTSSGLNVSGPDGVSAMLKEVSFAGVVTVEITWPQSGNSDGLVELRLDEDGKKGTRFAVYLTTSGERGAKLLRAEGAGKLEEATDWIRGHGSITLTLGDGKAVLTSDTEGERAEAPAPQFSRLLLILAGVLNTEQPLQLGGGDRPAPSGSITWPKLGLGGALRPEWRRKTLAGYNSLLYRELLREPQITAAAAPPPKDPSALPVADDALALAGMTPEQLELYRAGWTALAGGEVDAALDAFESTIQARTQAGAYYGRALGRLAKVDYLGSEGDLDVAISLDPGFADALIARAALRSLFGDLISAEADLDAAALVAPGSAEAYRGRGRIALENEAFAQARDDLGLALALDPTDAEARRMFLSVQQVVTGPPWKTTHTHETDHFRVRTNISEVRATQVGEQLEKARRSYRTVLGDPAAEYVKETKASCLVFDTAEGFFNYGALIRLDEGDTSRTLGLYSPLYKQLLFFEDANDVDGSELREVMYHEGFHRYADEVMPGLPTWLNEGLAEVFAAELTERPNGILEGRLGNLEDALEAGQAPSLETLMRMSHERFYAEGSHVNYAMAWAVCRYLVRGSPPAAAKDALQSLLDKLRERTSPEKAFQEAFEGVDLTDLEQRWRGFVKTLR